MKPKPCPFCGSSEIIVQEGSTFRWMAAACFQCEAVGPEVHVQTLGPGNPADWKIAGKEAAIREWNARHEQESPE